MIVNLENILNLVKEDITRKFTTSKNISKINEIFQNNFEIVKDYFKRCLTHTINVKVNVLENLKNGFNELNEIHMQEKRNYLTSSNLFNNKIPTELQGDYILEERFVENINMLSAIIKDYMKSTRTLIKNLFKDSDIFSNKILYVKSSLTNLISQNLNKTIFNNQNKLMKGLIEKFDEIEIVRFESNRNIKSIESESLKFYEDAKVIFKILKNLHNAKLKDIQNNNNINTEYSDVAYTNHNKQHNELFTQNVTKLNKNITKAISFQKPKGKSYSIDHMSREGREHTISASPNKTNYKHSSMYPSGNLSRNKSVSTNIFNTSSGNSIYNTSTNIDNSYSNTHSNFTMNKRLNNKLNKSVDSFNRNVQKLERACAESNISNVNNIRESNNSYISNKNASSKYQENYNKLFAEFESIKNKNSELNLQLDQLQEAFVEIQCENQRLKSENDVYYKHLIQAGNETDSNTNTKFIQNNQVIPIAPYADASNKFQVSYNIGDENTTRNLLDKLANIVISFTTHMAALQEAINKKSTNIKEMKQEFELKKKEMIRLAHGIIATGNNYNIANQENTGTQNISKNPTKITNNNNSQSEDIDRNINKSKYENTEENLNYSISPVKTKPTASEITKTQLECENCKNSSNAKNQRAEEETENYKNLIKSLSEELTNQTNELNEKLIAKSSIIEKLEEDNKIISEELAQLKLANEELVNENKKLFSDNQQMAEEFTKLQDYFQTMEEAKIAELKSAEEIEKKKFYIKELEDKNKNLNEEIKAKKLLIENLSNKLNTINEEKISILEIFNNNKMIIDDLTKKNLHDFEEKKILNEQLKELNTKIKNLNSINEANLKEIKELKENNSSLINRKNSLDLQQLRELQEKLLTVQNENKILKNETDKKNQEKEILSNQKYEIQSQLFILENKLKEYETNIIPNLKKSQEKYELKIQQEYEKKMQNFYETLSQRENELMEMKDKYNKLQQNLSSSSIDTLQVENLKLKILEGDKTSNIILSEYESLKKDFNTVCQLIRINYEKFMNKCKEIKQSKFCYSKNYSQALPHSQTGPKNLKNYAIIENENEINEIEEEGLLIDEEIEIKEEELEHEGSPSKIQDNNHPYENTCSLKKQNDNNLNFNPMTSGLSNFPSNNNFKIFKELEKIFTNFSHIFSETFLDLEEKIKEYSIKESQFLQENNKLKLKFDECIQIIHDAIASSSPEMLQQFGLLDNDSDVNSSNISEKKEIEIDFIQKAVDLFKLFLDEINEENKKLKHQIEEITHELKIHKIKSEEYKSALDMAILNKEFKEEHSFRKKDALQIMNTITQNENSLYTLNKESSNFENNNEQYENNLTVDDLIEDKNIFLEIIKKEQNETNISLSPSVAKKNKNEEMIEKGINLELQEIKRKYEELLQIHYKCNSDKTRDNETVKKYEVLLRNYLTEKEIAYEYKNKYEELLKENQESALKSKKFIEEEKEKDKSDTNNYKNYSELSGSIYTSNTKNKIIIPKLQLKAINKSFSNKEDMAIYEDFENNDKEDNEVKEENYLEKLNRTSYNQYKSEKNANNSQNINTGKNPNNTVAAIRNQGKVDFFAKLNLNRNENHSLDYVKTDRSGDTENMVNTPLLTLCFIARSHFEIGRK